MIAVLAPSSTVEVLLSTHNGERYVVPQLASILSQSHSDIRVVVRDDASTDRTVELVREIAEEDSRVSLVTGPRLGWRGSFMELLASSDALWIAFADQDDVWLPDRIQRGMTALEPLPADRPALYGSAMLHVSEDLRWRAESRPPRRVSFENALVQNVVAGCTMLFNRAAAELCLHGVPRSAPHDWWLYLVTSAFGTVIFDDAATVLHRVHADNATALPLPEYWLRRVTAHVGLAADRRPSRLVRDFQEMYSDRLSDEQRTLVEDLMALQGVSWLSRARYASRCPVYRQSPLDNLILRVLLTLGRF